MHISIVSNLCSLNEYNYIIPKKYRMGQQYQKYFRLIAEGLKKNGCDVSAVSVYPVNRKNNKGKYFKKKIEVVDGIEYTYLNLINIPVLKNLSTIINVFFAVALMKRNETIIVDLLNLSISVGAFLGAKISKVKIVGVLTDMPTIYVGNEGGNPTLQQRLNQKACRLIPDAYLLLTNEMNTVINTSDKPSIIIEGFADAKMQDRFPINTPRKDRYCIYAGGLNKLYGLDMLVEGFIQADISDLKLKICGAGPYLPDLMKLVDQYACIEYCGVLDNSDVLDLEEGASLLINPRYTHFQFTRFSFPSKNMEYMSTGVPVLTTNLPGMPQEYHSYVYLLEDETVTGMANMLKQIFQIPDSIRMEKGIEAKNWILSNKNNIEMTGRLLTFISNLNNN